MLCHSILLTLALASPGQTYCPGGNCRPMGPPIVSPRDRGWPAGNFPSRYPPEGDGFSAGWRPPGRDFFQPDERLLRPIGEELFIDEHGRLWRRRFLFPQRP